MTEIHILIRIRRRMIAVVALISACVYARACAVPRCTIMNAAGGLEAKASSELVVALRVRGHILGHIMRAKICR